MMSGGDSDKAKGLMERTEMWTLGVTLNCPKKRNEVIRKTQGIVCVTGENRRSQIGMIRSCDEKRGRKLHEMNCGLRCQPTLQSGTGVEEMETHDTTRPEVSN